MRKHFAMESVTYGPWLYHWLLIWKTRSIEIRLIRNNHQNDNTRIIDKLSSLGEIQRITWNLASIRSERKEPEALLSRDTHSLSDIRHSTQNTRAIIHSEWYANHVYRARTAVIPATSSSTLFREKHCTIHTRANSHSDSRLKRAAASNGEQIRSINRCKLYRGESYSNAGIYREIRWLFCNVFYSFVRKMRWIGSLGSAIWET